MSQTIVLEISDEVYAVIRDQAVEANTSPAQIAAKSLERQFVVKPTLFRELLIAKGLMRTNAQPLTDALPLSEAERRRLAQEVVNGRSLSDYICEERDEN